MLTVGVMAASVARTEFPEVPYGLLIACFMAGIPAGICPMPSTLIALVTVIFFFGLGQIAPIFISVLTSYMIVCGSGLFAAIAERQQAREKAAADAEAAQARMSDSGKRTAPDMISIGAQTKSADKISSLNSKLAYLN